MCRPHMHETQVKPHLQCGTDPTMIRAWSDHDPSMIRPHTRPSRTRRTAEVDHRGSGTDFVWKNLGFRASAISQKRISCETSFKTPSATHPPAPLAIPFTLRERSYSCKSQWNSVDRTCTKHRWNPIYNAEPIRTWSAHDPNMIRPHTRPSRTRRTAEVDHRGSGTDFVWKNIGFRASAISQKRISCETSFKTPSATPPPAPLAMPFPLRERSYSCKSQWNSIGNSSTSTTCNPIYIAGTILQLQITMEFCRPHMHETQVKPHLQCGTDPNMIRPWSEHDPTTHETVSHPSHRRGRSSRFGDGLCMEKHRVSCICYLSKTHFVRDFLQNSIGNSSTSTTCNAICIAGTILQLQITMEFHRQLIHQHHLQSHLHCGNDPTVANHNGILSTAHARNTGETPFTMRNRSEHDPPMIRPHTRPSRTRRTAEVDHRGSGTDFVWKNIGFRASALSKTHFVRDFLQNSIGNSSTSTTCNAICIAGTILQLCKSQWNSIGNSSTSTTCNPIYIAGTILQLQITMEFCRPHMHETQVKPHLQCGTDPNMIRPWSEHDPTTHETVSHPSHRRGRSSRFGDGLCMEKHKVSCICYLSKTHFVRDFLQKSNLKMSFTINSVPH